MDKASFMAGAKAMLRAIGERVVDCADNCRDFDCLCGNAYFCWFEHDTDPSDETLRQDALEHLWEAR